MTVRLSSRRFSSGRSGFARAFRRLRPLVPVLATAALLVALILVFLLVPGMTD